MGFVDECLLAFTPKFGGSVLESHPPIYSSKHVTISVVASIRSIRSLLSVKVTHQKHKGKFMLTYQIVYSLQGGWLLTEMPFLNLYASANFSNFLGTLSCLNFPAHRCIFIKYHVTNN